MIASRPFRVIMPVVFSAALLALAGCQAFTPRGPNEIDPLSIETRDDIVQVVAYWPQTAWTYDSDGNPKGIRPAVYFVSGQLQKGAFVSGPITISVSEVSEGGAGERSGFRLLHEWRFDSAVHRSFRIAKKAITGYYYGFPLDFPPGVDVTGKEVEIVVAYRRSDGREIKSTPKRDQALALRWPRTSPVSSPTPRSSRSRSLAAADRQRAADAREADAAREFDQAPPPVEPAYSNDGAEPPLNAAPSGEPAYATQPPAEEQLQPSDNAAAPDPSPAPRPRSSVGSRLRPTSPSGGPTIHRFRPVQAGPR